MKIAVIIVNYGTADLAIAAVESVRTEPVEIHLVDNASPDGEAAKLQAAHEDRKWGSQVTLWLEPENHGFGRGNNLVLKALAERMAGGETPVDYVFLLNPDARIENDAVTRLADYLKTNLHVGAVGAGVAMPDGTRVTAAFRFPGAAHEIANVINFGPVSRLLKTRLAPLPENTPSGPVGWVTGAAVMFRFSAIRQAGFFDPAFFLYFEEVDLMRRLTEAGWEVHYHPEARVVHHEGAATNVESSARDRRRRPHYLYQSWRRYFTKTQGRAGALAMGCAVFLAGGAGLMISTLRRQPTRLPLSFFRDQWRYVIAPLSGLTRDAEYDENSTFGLQSQPVTPRGLSNQNPAGIGFWALVAEDFRTHERDLFSQGFWALFWHRYGNWRMSVRPRLLRVPFSLLYKVMHKISQWICGIDLPYSVVTGRRVKLEHFGGMILVAERIGDDVTIRQNTTFGIAGHHNMRGRPSIGNRVEIGAGAVLIGDIAIGEGAVIGANAVVIRDIPANAVAVGVPARVLGENASTYKAYSIG